MSRRRFDIALGALLFVSLFTHANLAQAQGKKTISPEAVALFDKARALMTQGKHAEACPMLEKAQALGSGIGITYNMADCYEHIGRTASAWIGFQDAASAADAAGQSERAKAARERVAALAPKLTRLRIIVPEQVAMTPGLDVQRNGISIGKLVWGKDVPVDPDTYTIGATAPARAPWNTTVVAKKPGDVIEVSIPALAPAQSPDSSAVPSPLSPVWFIASGTLAVVGLGLGIGMTVAANGKSSDAEALRSTVGGPSGCYQPSASLAPTCSQLLDTVQTRDTLSNVAVGGFVVGGVLALGTAGLFTYTLMNRSASDEEGAPRAATVRVIPVIDAANRGIAVVGAW